MLSAELVREFETIMKEDFDMKVSSKEANDLSQSVVSIFETLIDMKQEVDYEE